MKTNQTRKLLLGLVGLAGAFLTAAQAADQVFTLEPMEVIADRFVPADRQLAVSLDLSPCPVLVAQVLPFEIRSFQVRDSETAGTPYRTLLARN